MNKMEWIAPCHFGLESVLKREIQGLGYEISQVEDGRVTFYGEADAACRANIFLRTAERVLLKVGSFKAVTFHLSVCTPPMAMPSSSQTVHQTLLL